MAEPTKFLGKSRAFSGWWLPSGAIGLNQTGIGASFGKAEPWVELGMTLLGFLMWLWHQRHPDPRRPVLRPKVDRLVSKFLILALCVVPTWWAVGCAGERVPVITAEQCVELVRVAEVMFEECEYVAEPDDPDRAEKVGRCYRLARAGSALAIMGCGFIPPAPPIEPTPDS